MRKYLVETLNPQDDKRMEELMHSGTLRVTEVTDPRLMYPDLYTPVTPEERERRRKIFRESIGILSDKEAEDLKARIYKDRDEWRA